MVNFPFSTSIKVILVTRKSLPKIIGVTSSTLNPMIIESARNTNLSTLTNTYSIFR